MVVVDSFPRYMSSFYSCSHTFSDLYHLLVLVLVPVCSKKISFAIVSRPDPSQCGIYFVAHSVSVSLYRIILGTLKGVERLGDSTML